MRLIKLTPLLLILLCSCSKTTATKTLFAMDTVMNISIHSKDSANQVSEIEKMIFDIDKKLDRKSENSEIGALNKNGTDEISQDTLRLIDKSIQLYEETDGCFDITIAPLMDLWGFYEKDYHVPTDTEISSLVIGSDKIQISDNRVNLNGTQIDLGGIAKGHTSDVITDYLKAQGVQSAIISLGGNVYALGQKPNGEAWKVAITDPSALHNSIYTSWLTALPAPPNINDTNEPCFNVNVELCSEPLVFSQFVSSGLTKVNK